MGVKRSMDRDDRRYDDPDYSPDHQDEYQRLWHDAEARVKALQAANERLQRDLQVAVTALRLQGKDDLYDDGLCFCDRHFDYEPHAEHCWKARQALAQIDQGDRER